MWLYVPLLLAVACLNFASSRLAARRANALFQHPFKPLPDLGHVVLPRIPIWAPDAYLNVTLAVLWLNRNHLPGLTAALPAATLSLAIRAATIHLTLLPSPLPPTTPAWVGTHDLMFSGHTICFCAAGHALGVSWLAAVGALVIIAARTHYTIDVMMAMLVFQGVL